MGVAGRNAVFVIAVSILATMAVLCGFFLLQAHFIIGDFRPVYLIMPSVVGLLMGTLIGLVLVYRAHLKARAQAFRALLDSAPVFTFFRSAEGAVIYASPAAQAMTGFPPDAYIEDPDLFESRIHPEDRMLWHHYMRRYKDAAAQRKDPIDIRFIRADGRVVWLSHSIEPARLEADGPEGVRAISIDVSARKELEHRFREEKRRAEAANAAKSAFLANMSHELRTPLNAIIGFSDVMEAEMFGPVTEPHYREYINHIGGSGRHLLGIINDILDLSRVEAGRAELDEKDLDLHALADDCLAFFAEQAHEKAIRIENHIPEHLPALRADERKVKQILLNLVSNAVKFVPPRGRIALEAAMEDGEGMKLFVSDTGPGIKADEIPRLMEPFTQAEGYMVRQNEGTGLGLPLAKAFAELHGGTLDLHSRVGEGTTATIYFPLERILAGPSGPSTPAPTAAQ
jgi:PAS domain S-box-containing protein